MVSVAAFGATTGINYARSGLVSLRVAALFIVGGVLGGFVGVALGGRIARHESALRVAVAVVAIGVYVVARGAMAAFAV